MLISSRRYTINPAFVSLPRWILASLGLGEGKTAYLALNTYKPTDNTDVRELVISPFPPDLWGDLWRIQVQFASGTGQVADLTQFLEGKGFDILAFEAYEGGRFERTDRDETPLNSFHVIVSGKHYRSPNDGTSKQRYDSPFFRMRDLYDEISIEFISRLNFVNRKTPRLTIRRLAQHRILKHEREVHAGQRKVDDIGLPIEIVEEPAEYRKKRDALEKHRRKATEEPHVLASEGDKVLGFATRQNLKRQPKLAVELDELLTKRSDKLNQITIMPTADAYERLIRIIPDKVAKPNFGHVVIIKGDGEPSPLRAVGQSLSELDANIIKVQVRRGGTKYAKKVLSDVQVGSTVMKRVAVDEAAAKTTQIDVTFSWPPSAEMLDVEGFWAALEHKLRRSLGTFQRKNAEPWRRTFAVWSSAENMLQQNASQPAENDRRTRPTLTSKALESIERLSEERVTKQRHIANKQKQDRDERDNAARSQNSNATKEQKLEEEQLQNQERQEAELAMLTAKLQHVKRVALNQIEIGKAVKGPSIFVSYSKTGARLVNTLQQISQRRLTSEIITNGFDGSYDDTKLALIWRRIAQCDAFIGIWTADLPLDEKAFSKQDLRKVDVAGELVWRTHRQGLPSPWLPFEWGMAVSLGKPYYLIVEKGIPEDYSLKVTADVPHSLGAFSMTPDNPKEDFGYVAEEALTAAIFRYFKKLGIISDFIDGITHGS